MDLMTLEAIRRVKYKYLRCVDLKRWDELAEALTEDAVADYGTHAPGGPLRLAGRAEILGFLRDNLGPDIITEHVASHPEIDVDGDTASGSWFFADTVIETKYRVVIRGSAYYHDEYRRGSDGKWRISHTGYERTFETMMSLDDLPSLKFLTNRWDTREAQTS